MTFTAAKERQTPLHQAWQLIHPQIAAKKKQIAAEILYYPPPIPACDAQFNFLLAERARVHQLWGQLESWQNGEFTEQEQLEWLETFLAASSDLDEQTEQEVRSLMKKMGGG